MGQVYQATDTKLKRQVALKIRPEAFSADPDRGVDSHHRACRMRGVTCSATSLMNGEAMQFLLTPLVRHTAVVTRPARLPRPRHRDQARLRPQVARAWRYDWGTTREGPGSPSCLPEGSRASIHVSFRSAASA